MIRVAIHAACPDTDRSNDQWQLLPRAVRLDGSPHAPSLRGLGCTSIIALNCRTFVSLENSMPALIFGALLLAWIMLSNQRSIVLLLLCWALLQLVGGGILSVLPVPVLPFYPEQSVQHYVMHLVYGAAQMSLIGILLRHLQHFHER